MPGPSMGGVGKIRGSPTEGRDAIRQMIAFLIPITVAYLGARLFGGPEYQSSASHSHTVAGVLPVLLGIATVLTAFGVLPFMWMTQHPGLY